MGRILSIDYGGKRTGLAVTDPLKIIATALGTVDTPKLMSFLKDYFAKEAVEKVIVGMPLNWDESATHATPLVERFLKDFSKQFPQVPIETVDERFTSKMAWQAMIDMGIKKKKGEDKNMVNRIAATIMLQEYMQKHNL